MSYSPEILRAAADIELEAGNRYAAHYLTTAADEIEQLRAVETAARALSDWWHNPTDGSDDGRDEVLFGALKDALASDSETGEKPNG